MTAQAPDPATRERLFRLIRWVFVADLVMGFLLWLFAGAIGGALAAANRPGDSALADALELVGLGLTAAGGLGYLMMEALARGARKRS